MILPSDTPTHYLYPASLIIKREPSIINTLLGSCVAIILYDKISKVSGMNHYMLPLWNGKGIPSPKYGNIAIEKLLQGMLRNGAKKENIVAKVFGGGEVIDNMNQHFKIGQRNIELAFDKLKELDIKIVAKSVGGPLGRKIQLNTSTGEIRMKYIDKTNHYSKNTE